MKYLLLFYFYLFQNKIKMLDQKYKWLDWSEGNINETLYMKQSAREKDVYLKVNNHSPEKLNKIIRKRTTDFKKYLKSG